MIGMSKLSPSKLLVVVLNSGAASIDDVFISACICSLQFSVFNLTLIFFPQIWKQNDLRLKIRFFDVPKVMKPAGKAKIL